MGAHRLVEHSFAKLFQVKTHDSAMKRNAVIAAVTTKHAPEHGSAIVEMALVLSLFVVAVVGAGTVAIKAILNGDARNAARLSMYFFESSPNANSVKFDNFGHVIPQPPGLPLKNALQEVAAKYDVNADQPLGTSQAGLVKVKPCSGVSCIGGATVTMLKIMTADTNTWVNANGTLSSEAMPPELETMVKDKYASAGYPAPYRIFEVIKAIDPGGGMLSTCRAPIPTENNNILFVSAYGYYSH